VTGHPSDAMLLLSLDALDGQEAAAASRHAEACPDCRRVLAAGRETAAGLALAATPVAPDPALRRRILEAAAAVPQAIPLVADPRREGRVRRSLHRRRRQPGTAVRQERFLDALGVPIRSVVALRPTGRGTRASAQVYVSVAGQPVGLAATGLPDPGTGVYQLWLLTGGRPAPVHAFRPDGGGQALVPFRHPLRPADGFAISLEAAPGLPAPRGPVLLASA
jgi:hypothetical protein